jgi:hypothetical protein
LSAAADAGGAGRPLRLPLRPLQRAALWLLVFSGGFVIVEPSPYEVAFAAAALLFALTGLRFGVRLAPLLILLVLFNLGGALALVPYVNEQQSVMFTAISVYMMLTTLFYAALVADDTLARLELIRSAYIASAFVVSIVAILGYFDVAGLGDYFSLYNRASGTFKDPNVLGPFLVLPIVYVMQAVMAGRTGMLKALAIAGPPLFALFLTFSRGAWVHIVASVAVLMLLTFVTSRNVRERGRIVVVAAAASIAMVLLLAAALSVDAIRTVFEIRASLEQDYDLGVGGRFGSQLRAIPLLLELPNGFGPLKFRSHFPEDPHSVYVNAFASYGWLGGLSYATLILCTWVIGWRAVMTRSPFQGHAIAIWATLSVVTLQGFQIDTDHWRHFYLLLGLMWGLGAIVLGRRDGARPAPARREGVPLN